MSNISMSVGGRFDVEPLQVGNCTFPYPTVAPGLDWYPPMKGLEPARPMIVGTYGGFNTGVKTVNNKEAEKLSRIKGLIEGFTLAAAELPEAENVGSDALLDKILKVIEE